ELPTLERAGIFEPGLLVLALHLKHREAPMRLPDEVVVRDDEPAPTLPDVLVQQLVRVPRGHAFGCDRVDEEAARTGLAHSGFSARSAKSHGTRRSRWRPR